jgi:hypothetical protein
MWILLSTAWIMGWTIQLIMSVLQNGVQTAGDVLVMPVLLLGPPLALLLFGIGAGWTLRGFKVDDIQSAPNEHSTAAPEPPVAPEESAKVGAKRAADGMTFGKEAADLHTGELDIGFSAMVCDFALRFSGEADQWPHTAINIAR